MPLVYNGLAASAHGVDTQHMIVIPIFCGAQFRGQGAPIVEAWSSGWTPGGVVMASIRARGCPCPRRFHWKLHHILWTLPVPVALPSPVVSGKYRRI